VHNSAFQNCCSYHEKLLCQNAKADHLKLHKQHKCYKALQLLLQITVNNLDVVSCHIDDQHKNNACH